MASLRSRHASSAYPFAQPRTQRPAVLRRVVGVDRLFPLPQPPCARSSTKRAESGGDRRPTRTFRWWLGGVPVAPRELYRAHEVLTAGGSHGKLVSERSRPGSARSAFHAAQAASTTAS